MATIKVDEDGFSQIVFSYLFDKLLHPDEVSKGNEEFTDIMTKLRPRLFPVAREMYLSQDADLRIKYKLIKDAFRGSKKRNTIFIVPKGEEKEEDPGIVKKIIRRVIKAIRSSKEFSTDEVDYIKEMLIEDENEKQEE